MRYFFYKRKKEWGIMDRMEIIEKGTFTLR